VRENADAKYLNHLTFLTYGGVVNKYEYINELHIHDRATATVHCLNADVNVTSHCQSRSQRSY